MKIEPDAAGMSEVRLERITEHFGSTYVDTGKIAGCQITVVRGGHVAYHRSLGLMDRERAIADGRRRHLPHLLHDQAHRLGRPDAALRAGHVPAARPGAPLHPRVAHPAGRRGRRRRLGHPGQAGAPDEHARRPDAHDRPARRPVPRQPHRRRVRRGPRRRSDRARRSRASRRCWPSTRSSSTRARTGTTGSRPTSWAGWSRSSPGLPLDEYLRRELFEPLGMVDTGFFVPEAIAAPAGRLLPVPPGQHARA